MLDQILPPLAVAIPAVLGLATAFWARQVGKNLKWRVAFAAVCTIGVVVTLLSQRRSDAQAKQERIEAERRLQSEILTLRRANDALVQRLEQPLRARLDSPVQITEPTMESRLCPDSLPYTLKDVEAPAADGYVKEITIRQKTVPMFSVTVHTRALVTGDIVGGTPDQSLATIVGGGSYSALLSSTKPTSVFKARLYSTEGVRVHCVNQDN